MEVEKPKEAKAPKQEQALAKAQQRAWNTFQKNSKQAMEEVQRSFIGEKAMKDMEKANKKPGSLVEVDEPKKAKAPKEQTIPTVQEMVKAQQHAMNDLKKNI